MAGASSEAFLGSGEIMVKNAEREIRMGFLRKVYGILSAQILLTVMIAAPIMMMSQAQLAQAQESGIMAMSFVASFGTVGFMICCGDVCRKFPANYICLLIMTVAMAVPVGFISAQFTLQSVGLAAGITGGVFICMTAYAWTTKTDFTGVGPYLMGALFALIAFSLVISVLGMCGAHIHWMVMLYDFSGVVLFTFYIVYDTQLMMGGDHKKVQLSIDEYCFAAMNLYLDIINLFLDILMLIGDRK